MLDHLRWGLDGDTSCRIRDHGSYAFAHDLYVWHIFATERHQFFMHTPGATMLPLWTVVFHTVHACWGCRLPALTRSMLAISIAFATIAVHWPPAG